MILLILGLLLCVGSIGSMISGDRPGLILRRSSWDSISDGLIFIIGVALFLLGVSLK